MKWKKAAVIYDAIVSILVVAVIVYIAVHGATLINAIGGWVFFMIVWICVIATDIRALKRRKKMTKTEKAVERQNLIDILDRNFGYTDDEPAHVVADRLIAAGYRKQSDTVKEFASKVKLYLEDVSVCGYIESAKLWQLCADISDLAEKYGKED